jgi:hypothetical protein
VETFLGLVGMAIFIVGVVSLAAGVTWLVVKISPNPEEKRARQQQQQQPES